MQQTRRLSLLATPLTALLLVFALASPAAAATLNAKLAVLSSWTQPTATSFNAWNAARIDQARWASYGFDWSTDHCSLSPDQPLGFDFRTACWHHDFGYRNYKALGRFTANRARVDRTFYFDMRTSCRAYTPVVRPACYSVAWTYYRAVVTFGALNVPEESLSQAATMKANALATAASTNQSTLSHRAE
ncbi:MAG TPA: phospholipase [Micromonosporaceae bacterium]|nr:phospholipase [Micromonosporaceae bacterium]